MGWLGRPASETQITHARRLWLYGLAVAIMAFLVAPTVIVIPMSFSDSQYLEFPPQTWSVRWYENYFGSFEWMRATATSFKAGFLTMVAIGVFYVYARIGMVNTLTGLVLAHAILAIPLVLVVVSSALKTYDMSQEMVARSLGASRFKAFMLVTLPQIRFAVITSALLAFLTSFDEVIIAMFVSGAENSTLTRNMFNALRDQIDPTIASISTVMIVVSSALLAATQLMGRGKG
jgi:putative spermidine/putrescine transport system permease protein